MEDEFFIKNYNNSSVSGLTMLGRIGNDLYWYYREGLDRRLIKTDENFSIQWEVDFGSNNVRSILKSSISDDIFLVGDKSVLVSGSFERKLFLAKISPAGNVIWDKVHDITISEAYLNFGDYIQPFNSNQYILRSFQTISIIDENGNIVASRRRRISGRSDYYEIMGLETHNNQVFVLYKDPVFSSTNLGELIILDSNLNFLRLFRLSGNPEGSLNETRLAKIGTKIYVSFNDVSFNVGIIPLDVVTDLGTGSTSGSFTGQRFTNSYSFENLYPQQIFVHNNIRFEH